jgi:protein O-mannosyl-transferase
MVSESSPQPVAGLSRRGFFVAAAIVLAVCAAYAHVLQCGFVNFDDGSHVTDNPCVRGGFSWENVRSAFSGWHACLWIPLTWVSLMTDVSLFGMDAGMMHAVNVLFHAANAVLLLIVLNRATGAFWQSAAVAALFALHPINVESVAWVTERKNVLSTFFALLSLLAYTRYAQRPSLVPYFLAWAAFACSLMAKPMLVTWAAVLVLWDVWPMGRLNRASLWRCLVEKLPFLLTAIAIAIVTMNAMRGDGRPLVLDKFSLAVRASNAVVSYGAYLRQLIWPADLAVLYPHPGVVQPIAAAASGLLLVAITVFAWRWRRSRPYVLIGWLWFLGMLVPVIGLVQVGPQARADRFTYLPQIGLLVAFVWSLRGRWIAAVVVPMASACSFVTARMVGFWKNGATLFERAVAVTHNNAHAYGNAGFARAELGDYAIALEHYRESLRILPDAVERMNAMGTVLSQLGRDAEAIPVFERVIELKPKFIEARYNLGIAMEQSGRIEEARDQFLAVLTARPDILTVRIRLAKLLENRGDRAGALLQLRAAAVFRPRDAGIAAEIARLEAAR